MTSITIAKSQKVVSQDNILNIILPESSQILFPLNIKSFDIIKEIRF